MNGIFLSDGSGAQYQNCTYTYGGQMYTGIHCFTTTSAQSIAPAVSTTKVALSNLKPINVPSSKVIAKINACMYDYETTKFYGLFYQGTGQTIYADGTGYSNYAAIPSNSVVFTDPKYYPSFCVKSDGSATIRWFGSHSELGAAIPYCNYIIGACHPLVYNSKCVFNENVYENDPALGRILIYNRTTPSASGRYNTGINESVNRRTLLGHLNGGNYIMIATDDAMPMNVAANMMQDLGCDYAVNMDGGSPSQMIVTAGYGASGRVTENEGRALHTAVCAYVK